jgi:quercetin dioxygenase-like cupin family protein
MKNMLRRTGKYCGIMSTGPDDLRRRLEQGFGMIGLGMDAGLLIRSLRTVLASVGRDREMRLERPLEDSVPLPATDLMPPPAMSRPPEALRPDRRETMVPPGLAAPVEISGGVQFECLVGAPTHARNLTTGLVTFAASASLPYHTHPFAESITLLRGQAVVEVEGRRYELNPLDNVTIPRGRAHAAMNTSPVLPAVFHIAMAAQEPTRETVSDTFSRQSMPADAIGVPGAERVTRFQSAPRFAAGPQTQFIDFCNADVMPGLEMSGGYGLFHLGGRLPAHVHDFDESISIITGAAVCIVEGRRYALSDNATAFVPRGRVHYFKNEAPVPMAILWYYAGPRPERLVVEEACATKEGCPWI